MKIPKIIALDIDGTLFDSKGRISQRTLKAIHACTQAGINVVFSTGRDYDSLPLAETDGSGMQYAVTTNGSAIYELGSRKCLWENPMDRKDIFDILSYSEKKDMFPFLFIDGRGYAEKGKLPVYERVNWPLHLKETTKHNMHLVDDLAEYVTKESHDVQKGAVLFPSSEDGTLIGWDEAREYLNAMPGVHAVDGGCDNLEFNRVDATKAAGLQILADMIGICMDETMAIGDSENDLDILRAAGTGIAMGNAPADIKGYADEVTLSNDEDGVAVVLERIASLI